MRLRQKKCSTLQCGVRSSLTVGVRKNGESRSGRVTFIAFCRQPESRRLAVKGNVATLGCGSTRCIAGRGTILVIDFETKRLRLCRRIQMPKVRLCKCVSTQFCGVSKIIDQAILGRNHWHCQFSPESSM